MYYEFNVSQSGQYIFATVKCSATNVIEAKRLGVLLAKKFPESEGYYVGVTFYPERGYTSTNLSSFLDDPDQLFLEAYTKQ